MTPDQLKSLIRTIPDFPEKGVQFRDITTLIGHGPGLRATVGHLAEHARSVGAEVIAGMEARGFIFGAAVAIQLDLGFIPLRKPGKLPVPAIGVDYALEYGTDRLEMDPGAITAGQKVVLVDDLVATGGTARAAARLLRQAGADVAHAAFVIDLPELGGANALRGDGVEVAALMEFAGQ